MDSIGSVSGMNEVCEVFCDDTDMTYMVGREVRNMAIAPSFHEDEVTRTRVATRDASGNKSLFS